MAKYSDVGKGALFENRERNHEKAPDKQGSITITNLAELKEDENGECKIYVSCWTDNKTKSGLPYFGLKLSVKSEEVPF